MSIIGVIIRPGNTGAEVHEVHKQLLAVGEMIAPDEQNEKKYGPSTVAAVHAFQQQYGLLDGDDIDPSTGRLLHVASVFAGSGDRVALRAAVREAASAADTSQPQELYWLARYATLAGDYQTAHDIARRIPDHPGVRAVIEPILAPPEQPTQPVPGQPPAAPQPRPPELSHPENFYAYRCDFYPLDVLNDVQRQIAEVGQLPRDPSQAQPFPGFPDGGTRQIEGSVSWFEALKQWQIGNAAFNRQEYGIAGAAYDACQSAACDYFSEGPRGFTTLRRQLSFPLTTRLSILIGHLVIEVKVGDSPLGSKIRLRRGLLSLEELRAWGQPPNVYIPRLFVPLSQKGILPPPTRLWTRIHSALLSSSP